MLIRRRPLLALLGAVALPPEARAETQPDTRRSPRDVGSAAAPVTVMEFFSLTCTHCAAFAHETYADVKTNLIDTGRVRYEFRDFPLDQVALTAAMVARALPPDRYGPFVIALLATQDRWAFARGVNSTEELARMAALAGMPREVFDATLKDDGLRAWILQQQDEAQKQYGIDSTPTFVFNGPKAHDAKRIGELSYDGFAKAVQEAAA